MERLSTGIKGLDERLEGGFPHPACILVAGEPGAGKTTIALQALFEGARRGEKGLYVTAISEPVDQLLRFTERYSFFDRKYLDDRKILFLDVSAILAEGVKAESKITENMRQRSGEQSEKSPEMLKLEASQQPKQTAEKALELMAKLVLEGDIRRVVIDPITPFAYAFEDEREYRKFLHEAFVTLKALGTLSIVSSEATPRQLTNIESYMADGVLLLYLQEYHQSGDKPPVYKPAIQIRKMRGTDHPKDALRMGFTKDGLRILQ